MQSPDPSPWSDLAAELGESQPALANLRLARRLKPGHPSGEMSLAEAAFLLRSACQRCAGGQHAQAAAGLVFVRALAALDAWNGRSLKEVGFDPLEACLFVAAKSAESTGQAWTRLAVEMGSKLAEGDKEKIRRFDQFMRKARPGGLKIAIDAGVAAVPHQEKIDHVFAGLLDAGYGKLGVKSKPLPQEGARVAIESLAHAGLWPSRIDPEHAVARLAQMSKLGGPKALAEKLLEAAGPLADQDRLTEWLSNASAGLGVRSRPTGWKDLHAEKMAAPPLRLIGALLRAPGWSEQGRSAQARAVCKKATQCENANRGAQAFLAAAGHCDWSEMAPQAGSAFGAGFMAQLERQSLLKNTPRAMAGPQEASSRPRL